MFARLTTAQVDINRIDEVIKFFEENVVPATKAQEGYRGIYLLTDRKRGKGISLSLWESEEDAIANEQSGYYQEQIGKLMQFFITSPSIEGYQISVQA